MDDAFLFRLVGVEGLDRIDDVMGHDAGAPGGVGPVLLLQGADGVGEPVEEAVGAAVRAERGEPGMPDGDGHGLQQDAAGDDETSVLTREAPQGAILVMKSE